MSLNKSIVFNEIVNIFFRYLSHLKLIKKNINLVIIILCTSSLIISCNIPKSFYKIECVSIQSEGYVKLNVSNHKLLTEYEIESASQDALRAVLFNGYSSTNCQTQKPLLNIEEAIRNFKKIEKNFFSKKGDWKNFVRNIAGSDNSKINEYSVMVSKDQLRKYLVEKKCIKSLLNGF